MGADGGGPGGGDGGGGVKPPAGPLEAALLAALRADPPDPAAVEAARLALVRQWDKLAWHQAGKWFARNGKLGTLDDYHGAATLGLWQAATRFEPERGWRFSTYATWYIRVQLRLHAFHESGRGLHVPANHGFQAVGVVPFGGAPAADGDTPFEQTIPQPAAHPDEEPPDPADVWPVVDRTLCCPRQKAVLIARFRDGKTLADFGERLGVSRARVEQVQRAAIGRLRKHAPQLAGLLAG